VNRSLASAINRVGGGKDRHRRAVIAIERDNRGGWIELLREIENVADRGRAKVVDRLGIIANDGQSLAIRLERQHDRRLDGIGVLILIHQHMIEQAANFARDFGHLHQFRPIEKKIVIVEDMLALLRLDIALEQAAKILFEAGAPGEMLCEHAIEGVPGIHRSLIDGKAGSLQRKALLLLGEA
jgi:hypothetical protein